MTDADRPSRLAALLERLYIDPDSLEYLAYQELWKAARGETDCARYAVVMCDRHDHYFCELVDTLGQARDAAQALLATGEFAPDSVYDLDTGQRLGLTARAEIAGPADGS